MEEENPQHRSYHLQNALNGFEELSKHCPMTPLLWIQYAQTAHDLVMESCQSLEEKILGSFRSMASSVRTETLELGVMEFPGSVLLQAFHIYHLRNRKDGESKKKLKKALDDALQVVGRGSHRNEGVLVAILYQWQAELALSSSSNESFDNSFMQRSRTPLKQVNESIVSEYEVFCRDHSQEIKPATVEAIESGRRLEALVFGRFTAMEDDVEAAMHEDGVLHRYALPELSLDTGISSEWLEALVNRGDHSFGMGLGGEATKKAFMTYAITMAKFRPRQKKKRKKTDDIHEEDDTLDSEQQSMEAEVSSIALDVFERGVAECPTDETLWLSYIRCLLTALDYCKTDKASLIAVRLQMATQRSVRNCPNSQQLVEQQLSVSFELSARGLQVLDPDQLMETVETALNRKFLVAPESFLSLYLQAIRSVKRRILHIMCEAQKDKREKSHPIVFDEPLQPPKGDSIDPSVPESTQEEALDLLDDLSDMFDEVETRLSKHHASWSEGRAILWTEQSRTNALISFPLKCWLESNEDKPSVGIAKDIVSMFDRAVKVHNPPHPDTYLRYIRQFEGMGIRNVGLHLRRLRFIYSKAIQSVGPSKSIIPHMRSFEVALADLGQEWIDFETSHGSLRSLGRAQKAIDRKRQKFQSICEEENNDRTETIQIAASMLSTDSVPMEVEDSVAQKPTEYKTHPFTVRVLNLHPDAGDMDLVDTFRPKCGAIVHARIVREKKQHNKGQSKGWGLVQFEERESVEKALSLHDEVGIKEKLVRVERSTMSAVTLVPPGQHRGIPKKGKEGESTNRYKQQDQNPNEKSNIPNDTVEKKMEDKGGNACSTDKAATVLSFHPRGVNRRARPKVKL